MATKKIKEGRVTYWIDPDGNRNRTSIIDKHVKKREKLVDSVFKSVDGAGAMLFELKKKVRYMVTDFLNKSAEDFNENWQGNTKLYNFAKDLSIEIAIAKKINLDERLQIAKSKIDKYVLSLVKESQKDLVTLVTKAFNVDKKGNVSVKDILSLRSYDITHPDWVEAMDLITKSISIDGTKTYYRFAKKNSEGKWEQVILNFSAI